VIIVCICIPALTLTDISNLPPTHVSSLRSLSRLCQRRHPHHPSPHGWPSQKSVSIGARSQQTARTFGPTHLFRHLHTGRKCLLHAPIPGRFPESLPDLFPYRLLTHAAMTRVVSKFRAFRSEGVIARMTSPPLGLCRAEFRILERSIAPSGP
jgi:hypothetical protein